MYCRANWRKRLLPDLHVFLEDFIVALSNKRAAAGANVVSVNKSPNNLKSHAGPSEENKIRTAHHNQVEY